MFADQKEYDICCEWGLPGLEQLAPTADLVIIVDVFSFSTSVDMAVSRCARVFPYAGSPSQAQAFAENHNALLASRTRSVSSYSLSPSSLRAIPRGKKLVLLSRNGSILSNHRFAVTTLSACLRNAGSVAAYARHNAQRIAVIPAGEKWPDGSLRPAFEDWVGAGAVIHHLNGSRSPEALAAQVVFERSLPEIETHLHNCSSGKELKLKGFFEDIHLAAAYNSSGTVPCLVEGSFKDLAAHSRTTGGL